MVDAVQSPQAAAPPKTLLIACGALAREIVELIRREGWTHMEVSCLPAIWHNTPAKIPEGVRAKIQASRPHYEKIFVVYADCGTGGLLDNVLEEEGVERLPGPHCYASFAGQRAFNEIADDDPTCFYLTDFLVRHFDRFIVEGFGLDRYPEMRDMLFGNYTRLIYLAQTRDPALEEKAQRAAARLGLRYEYRFTGYGELESNMKTLA